MPRANNNHAGFKLASKMATPTTMSTSTTLSLKLLVDSKSQKVLFAEASKDVIDFLFSLLTLPLATAVKLLGEGSMPGCVASLYASVEELDATYFLQPAAKAKDALLRPVVLSPAASASSLLLDSPSFPAMKTFGFGGGSCKGCRGYVTDAAGTACPSCGSQMTTALQLVAAGIDKDEEEGFVRGVVTYRVMDDLKVAPMSAVSGITLLLSSFGVTDLTALREKTVHIGYNEGLEILKASLQSKTVLTDVFLANKPPGSGSNA